MEVKEGLFNRMLPHLLTYETLSNKLNKGMMGFHEEQQRPLITDRITPSSQKHKVMNFEAVFDGVETRTYLRVKHVIYFTPSEGAQLFDNCQYVNNSTGVKYMCLGNSDGLVRLEGYFTVMLGEYIDRETCAASYTMFTTVCAEGETDPYE